MGQKVRLAKVLWPLEKLIEIENPNSSPFPPYSSPVTSTRHTVIISELSNRLNRRRHIEGTLIHILAEAQNNLEEIGIPWDERENV